MAIKDYTDPLYEKLILLSSSIDCLKAYADLLPDDDNPMSPFEIIRHHAQLIDLSIDDVFAEFSSLSLGLRMDFKEVDAND